MAKLKPLAKLFAEADDSTLCSGIVDHIVAFYGNAPDPSEMPEAERVALLVLHTYGIIGNGGFNYLFEGELPGDPDYTLAAEAYELIGAETAADAFRQVFRLFPDNVPPRDAETRLRLYRRGPGANRGEIDRLFFSASKEIESCLARYIREHRDDYFRLEDQRPIKRSKPTEPVESSEPRQLDPVSTRMHKLPHWARVAFAAHCARVVYPFFPRFWPDATTERVLSVVRAIQLVEHSAEAGKAVDGLKEAASNALMAAGAALAISLYGYPTVDDDDEEEDEPGPPDGTSAVRAANIAKCAEFSANAAQAGRDESAQLAVEGYVWGRDLLIALDEFDMLEALHADFERLLNMSRKSGWTHKTPVPADVFDPQYRPPTSSKPWWKFW